MDMAGTGVDKFREGIDIRAEEFFQSSIVQYVSNYLGLAAQLLQHFLRCDVLPRARLFGLVYEFHFPEENLTHLLRT